MFVYISVKDSAANSSMPLRPVPVFAASACTIGILDVPFCFGTVSISAVSVTIKTPDGSASTVSARRCGNRWVATFGADRFAAVGSVHNGLTITAYGTEEDGETPAEWTLGKGDVAVLDSTGVPAPGLTWQDVHLRDEVPAAPQKGDLANVGGEWSIYTGIEWETLGGGGSVVESETNPGYAARADYAVSAAQAGSAEEADSVPWDGVYGKPNTFNPTRHSATHASYGSDPISPESIGALSQQGGSLVAEDGDTELEIGAVLVSRGVLRVTMKDPDHPASIRKNNKEVATEEQVESAKSELNARIDLIEATSHPNMTIVGSPTFREGNVSGFSASDYLVFPTAVSVGRNTVEFNMAFHTGDDVTTQQNLMDSWCGLAFAIRGGTTVTAISTNGTSFLAESTGGTIRANNSYRMKMLFSYEDGLYRTRVYLADGAGDFSEIGTGFTADAPLFATATYWGGANPGHATHVFGGIINLNECRMLVNGTEVWRGYDELPTVKFDPTATPVLDTAEKIVGQVRSSFVEFSGEYDDGTTFSFGILTTGA